MTRALGHRRLNLEKGPSVPDCAQRLRGPRSSFGRLRANRATRNVPRGEYDENKSHAHRRDVLRRYRPARAGLRQLIVHVGHSSDRASDYHGDWWRRSCQAVCFKRRLLPTVTVLRSGLRYLRPMPRRRELRQRNLQPDHSPVRRMCDERAVRRQSAVLQPVERSVRRMSDSHELRFNRPNLRSGDRSLPGRLHERRQLFDGCSILRTHARRLRSVLE